MRYVFGSKDGDDMKFQSFMCWRDYFLFCTTAIYNKVHAETSETKGQHLSAVEGTCKQFLLMREKKTKECCSLVSQKGQHLSAVEGTCKHMIKTGYVC